MSIPLRYLSGFIKTLSKRLKAAGSKESPKFIYIVIPPKHAYMAPESIPSHADLKDLADAVDGFSLMTYDYTASLKYGFCV